MTFSNFFVQHIIWYDIGGESRLVMLFAEGHQFKLTNEHTKN